MPLQIRRGTEAERQLLASPPQQGELVYITDSEQLYVGDGTSLLRDITPITGYTDENALDYIGSVLDAGPHTGISFAHDDGANTISASINPTQNLTTLTVSGNTSLGTTTIDGNLAVSGKLIADFNGTISGDDSTILVDGVENKINLDGTVKGDIIPDLNEAYDIGSNSFKFRDLYLSGSSLHLGAAEVTATGTTINLPVGSTVGGVAIMGGTESVLTDIQGSVFADDSTILVDAIAGQVTGNVNNDTVNTGSLIINKDLSTGGLLLETEGDGEDDYDLFTFKAYNDGADAAAQVMVKTRGTKASPAAIQNGDGIFRHVYSAFGDTTEASLGLSVVLDATADGAIASGQIPGKYEIITANASGVLALAVAFNSKQETVFGGPAQLKSYTTAERNALTGVNGQMIYNTDTSKIEAYAGGIWVALN